MDIRTEAVRDYLTQGIGYRELAKKYGVSRTTICKWVQIHQGIHNIAPNANQEKYYLNTMRNPDNHRPEKLKELEQKIALLEKQVAWEKLRGDALDTMINIAEKQLDISIRKKSGTQPSSK
jgi:transposase-like protein